MVDWRAIGAIMSVGMFVIAAMTVIGLVQMKEGQNIPSPGWTLDECDNKQECPTKEITNAGATGRGVFMGADGETDELLSRSAYALSHESSGRSQDIVIQGQIEYHGCALEDYEYKLYLKKTKGGSWTNWQNFYPPSPGGIGNVVNLEARMTNIIGYEAEGALKVMLKAKCWGGTWVHLAEDWAYLRTGIGEIRADDQKAVGETITVTWEIPYVTIEGGAGAEGEGRTGFYLVGNHLDTGKSMIDEATDKKDGTTDGKYYLTSLQGTYSYKVLAEDYVLGSGGDCANNIIRWQLWSELWKKDWKDSTTIDVAGAGPVVMNLKWDKGTYNVGDSATLTWEVELGPEGFEIDSQKVIWGFAGPVGEVEVNATVRSYTTQGVGQTGKLHGEVIAYDSACRPSAVADTYANVQDPNQPSTPPGGSSESIVWAFALLFAVLLSIIILYVVSQFVQVGGWINYVILAVIWLATAIPLYYGLLIVFEAVEALI